jgi:hypothetical protein
MYPLHYLPQAGYFRASAENMPDEGTPPLPERAVLLAPTSTLTMAATRTSGLKVSTPRPLLTWTEEAQI